MCKVISYILHRLLVLVKMVHEECNRNAVFVLLHGAHSFQLKLSGNFFSYPTVQNSLINHLN